MNNQTQRRWLVDFELDDLDSAASVLRIVDGTSLDHPQGALTIATVNVAAHAPHLDEPISNAFLMASAPILFAAAQSALALLQNPDAEASDADRVEAELISALTMAASGSANGGQVDG